MSRPISGLLVLVVTLGCSAGMVTGTPAPAAAPKAAVANRLSWETEWQKTLEVAKQETKLVLYTTAVPEARLAFSKALKEKYGLEMEFVVGRGAELIAKLLAERRAGLYTGDVYIAGSGPAIENLLPAAALDPLIVELILPEVTDSKNWYGNQLPFAEKTQTLFAMRGDLYRPIAINTSVVRPEEIVSYRDLLAPRFKGKIVMGDPTVAGTANATATGVAEYVMDYDFMRELARQEPAVLRDERLVTEWLAREKYWIAFGARSDLIAPLKKAGAPVQEIIPKEGTFINASGVTVSVLNRRPHPNAARVFVNWLLTRDGQTVYVKGYGFDSLREDVAPASSDPNMTRQPGKNYKLILDAVDWGITEDKATVKFKEILAPLMK